MQHCFSREMKGKFCITQTNSWIKGSTSRLLRFIIVNLKISETQILGSLYLNLTPIIQFPPILLEASPPNTRQWAIWHQMQNSMRSNVYLPSVAMQCPAAHHIRWTEANPTPSPIPSVSCNCIRFIKKSNGDKIKTGINNRQERNYSREENPIPFKLTVTVDPLEPLLLQPLLETVDSLRCSLLVLLQLNNRHLSDRFWPEIHHLLMNCAELEIRGPTRNESCKKNVRGFGR